MPHNRVFISYSHYAEDQKLLEELRVHLKPWEKTTLLDIWSDHRIKPGDDWHRKIQDALESTAVAILLVSPEFLTSEYIRKYELPYLLRACEEGHVKLVCLYLRHSSVAHDDAAIEVKLSSGKTKRIKLTQYQGFNDPKIVVASLLERNQRDAVYAKAAADLSELIAPPSPPRSLTGKRYELTVQFKRNGNQLIRIYLHQYGRFAEYGSPWQRTGQALFDILFGSQEQCDKVLRALFDAKDLARPIRHPVRVRLHTHDPELANLPWAETEWEGNNLCKHGWTFELINDKTLHDLPNIAPGSPVIELKAPCPVLMIAPSGAPDAEGHHRAVEERLKQAWPFYHGQPHLVRDWTALEQIWQRGKPRIVYYYGPAESDGRTLTLLLDGAQGIDRRPVTALAHLWQADPPQIVFCNLVGESVSPGVALSGLTVPPAITQSSVDPIEARRTVLEWLHALLEGNEDTDPVWALHQHGLNNAVAWGAYGTWRTRTTDVPSRDKLARLLLDRRNQRSFGLASVNELVRDGERRLICVLAYGAEGNLVEHFAEQLYEYLRRQAKEVAQMHRVPLDLPTGSYFDVAKLEFEVRRQLGVGDRESFGAALNKRAPRGPGRARPVLLLNWRMRGVAKQDCLSPSALEAWLLFSRQQLSTQCPKDLRILSCLSLELAEEHHATLKQTVRNLRADVRFRDRAFKIDLLPPLDIIEDASDLAEFLHDPGNSSCPEELIATIPELIVNETGGRFGQTVELIERAERTSWWELHDELVVQSGQHDGASMTKPKDELL